LPSYADFWQRQQEGGRGGFGLIFDRGPQEIPDFVRDHRIPYRQLSHDKVLADYGRQGRVPTTSWSTPTVSSCEDARSRSHKFKRLQDEVDRRSPAASIVFSRVSQKTK